MKIDFLESAPVKKTMAKQPTVKPSDKKSPKDDKKNTSPPPKPAPGIKTKSSDSPSTTKGADKKNTPSSKPKGNTLPQKPTKNSPAKQKAETKAADTALPTNKKSQGIVKKQQEIESVDAVLNTLLPNIGGETNDGKAKKEASDANEMPDILEHKAVETIRSQIEEVWNYNPTEGINFYLTIKIDPSGKILSLKLSGTDRQNPLQKAAAESAYRSTLRLNKFKLKPSIFKPEHYKNGWSEIELHFRPRY